MKMSEALPERISDEGVHIYAADPRVADQLEAVVKEFPKVWVNIGLIDVPEGEMMKVPLVEGWQNQKIASRSYPSQQARS
jgi:hypothetical protein